MTPAALVVFVPTKLVNPLNGSHGHWTKTAKRRQAQRDAVAAAVYTATRGWKVTASAHIPKRITFTGYMTRKMDSDGFQAACKSLRDGLQDCGLIHSDGPDSGHTFTYAQRVAKPTGVEIRVELSQ